MTEPKYPIANTLGWFTCGFNAALAVVNLDDDLVLVAVHVSLAIVVAWLLIR